MFNIIAKLEAAMSLNGLEYEIVYNPKEKCYYLTIDEETIRLTN